MGCVSRLYELPSDLLDPHLVLWKYKLVVINDALLVHWILQWAVVHQKSPGIIVVGQL